MIFKVQRPMTNPADPWLIYTEGHGHMSLLRASLVPKELHEALRDHDKAYFEGDLIDGQFVVRARVPDQDW